MQIHLQALFNRTIHKSRMCSGHQRGDKLLNLNFLVTSICMVNLGTSATESGAILSIVQAYHDSLSWSGKEFTGHQWVASWALLSYTGGSQESQTIL